jgi:hypothetical protein
MRCRLHTFDSPRSRGQLSQGFRPFQREILRKILATPQLVEKRLIDVPNFVKKDMVQVVPANLVRRP